ncbi:hypothetical protein Q8F55_003913 [Vanrija albida]|uniref:Major facilitator superfamily (MFS) profile domain-containing protein n=1 Tax=Vanrija albida TaxID=181172 RepID=A0ABR3Q5A0_9TREE
MTEKIESPPAHHPNALERLTSLVTGEEPPATPTTGEYHTNYVFARLREDKPPPGRYHMWGMLAALYLVMFLAGWNDGTQGPLLPSLQEYYNINYLVISIIWVFNMLGFLLAGLTNVFLTDRFGFGIVAPFGAMCQVLGYIFMCWGPPYPLFCFAFVCSGYGLGLQDAQVNTMASRLPNANNLLFLMHAVYGLGATASPLVATQFVKHVRSKVYYYYFVSLGLGLATAVTLLVVFQLRTEDQVAGRRVEDHPESVPQAVTETETKSDGEGGAEVAAPAARTVKTGPTSSGSKMKQIMRISATHYMALFILLYVGVEVGIGGWATSFLIAERGGGDSSGYVSAGYFGGLTIGRVVLIPVTNFIGKRLATHVFTLLCIALMVVVWTVKSLIGNAVAYAFVGVFLGPMYPIVMIVILDVMPFELQAGTIGWIASLGQVGSAFMPFVTGAISQKHGVWILQPLMISIMGVWMVCWALVPRTRVQQRA